MIEGKVLPGRPRRTFIGPVKKDADSWELFKRMTSYRQELFKYCGLVIDTIIYKYFIA